MSKPKLACCLVCVFGGFGLGAQTPGGVAVWAGHRRGEIGRAELCDVQSVARAGSVRYG